MNTFEMKTAIHFGDNALDRLKEIPYKRVLIITDPFVVQSKMINLITAPLNSAGIEYDIFHDVVPDAPVDKIAGSEGGSVWVSTFHSTCVRILRRHIDRLGYDNNFTIYDILKRPQSV